MCENISKNVGKTLCGPKIWQTFSLFMCVLIQFIDGNLIFSNLLANVPPQAQSWQTYPPPQIWGASTLAGNIELDEFILLMAGWSTVVSVVKKRLRGFRLHFCFCLVFCLINVLITIVLWSSLGFGRFCLTALADGGEGRLPVMCYECIKSWNHFLTAGATDICIIYIIYICGWLTSPGSTCIRIPGYCCTHFVGIIFGKRLRLGT